MINLNQVTKRRQVKHYPFGIQSIARLTIIKS